MVAPLPDIRVQWHSAMAEIDRDAWNALALPLATPFLEWEWLHLMEASGSITPQTGWEPSHLTLRQGGKLIAAAALYIKHHSEGEFIYSHLWGEVARKLELPYYPYLLGMSPVTPVEGYRFLVAPDHHEGTLTSRLLAAIYQRCRRKRLSGVNFIFADGAWGRRMAAYHFTPWLHQSYRWQNPGFKDFDDYLARFRTNQRRNIKRERCLPQRQGIRLEPLRGTAVTPALLDLMYRYYADTNDRYGPWGCKYLTPAFFTGLKENFGHRLMLMAALPRQETGPPPGLALFIHKGTRLYGRYWGCAAPLDSLHFNTCFYAPIEWAIAHGIQSFDPGMGAHHKLRRGISSVGVLSLHRFFNPVLQGIMNHHVERINRSMQNQIDDLNRQLPFARTPTK